MLGRGEVPSISRHNYVSCLITKHLLYLGTILEFSGGKSLPNKLLFTLQNPSHSNHLPAPAARLLHTLTTSKSLRFNVLIATDSFLDFSRCGTESKIKYLTAQWNQSPWSSTARPSRSQASFFFVSRALHRHSNVDGYIYM